MAIGKNKKKPKKTAKSKRAFDIMSKKEWYYIRAPSLFAGGTSGAPPGIIGRTFVNKSVGGKLASDMLLNRVYSVSLADLNKDHSEDQGFRIIKLITDKVVNDTCLTNFYGMTLTTDRVKSLVRKWQTLIEASVEVKTTDGNIVRLFALTFTKRRPGQVKKTCYAKSSHVKTIRHKIREIIVREASGCNLKQLFEKLCYDVIGKNIEREASRIYPLQNTCIRKAKIIHRAKTDLSRLAEIHSGFSQSSAPVVTEDVGTPIVQTA